ncbi:radical SAM protein [Streptomyces albus subsp. chlorinus]|uniref:B12-binding domain-containing radical SAM protein n=1 Tax=Streptomyces albus TaxID=1888 RepID=UPI0015711A22|nr:radical SAM protein [Streptomyces albus]NSC25219.1 radical SAM protein [Streptomyces albus subsp. chlorinus]
MSPVEADVRTLEDRLSSFVSLAGHADDDRVLARAVRRSLLNPSAFVAATCSALRRPAGDVLAVGPVERRVLLLRRSGSSWAALSLSGSPLGEQPWPPAVSAELDFADPGAALSTVEVGPEAEFRLSRPVIKLVSLYHEENFPLPRFPLGISDLARAVRVAMTGQVELLDMQLGLDLDAVEARLRGEPFDILGISATFGQHDLLAELLGRLADLLGEPDGPRLVLGGSLCALNADLLLKSYPDAVVARGAGEPTMIDVVEHWHGDLAKEQIRNIRYRGDDTIEITPKVANKEYRDIWPELDLVERTLEYHGVMQLESSRGCTHACSFCPREHKGIWAGYEAPDLTRLLADIGPVYDRHPEIARKIFLVDEEFIGHDRRGEALQRAADVAVTLNQSGFRWETSSRVDQVHRPKEDAAWHHRRIDVWRKLRLNGLDRCLFGVESGVDSILKRFNKHVTAEQNVYAIRTLTGLGIPIRCTYITFDQLMTMDELIESYRFQGRRDLTLRPVPELTTEELFDLVRDEQEVKRYLRDRPFYEHISYMLVSMECLLRSPYLRRVEQAGLARDVLPSMGRRNAVFQDPRIGRMSDWAQRWVDHNFSLDYTLKSFEKVTTGQENEAVRRMRRALKTSAYAFLGRLLWLCLRDDSLLSSDEGPADAAFKREFGPWALTGTESDAADDDMLARLADFNLAELRSSLQGEFDRVCSTLVPTRVALLRESWQRWYERTDWTLINPPEQCVAE